MRRLVVVAIGQNPCGMALWVPELVTPEHPEEGCERE
jgi:hypothetical protein